MQEVIILIEEMFQLPTEQATTEAEETKRSELASKYSGDIEFVVADNETEKIYTPVLVKEN